MLRIAQGISKYISGIGWVSPGNFQTVTSSGIVLDLLNVALIHAFNSQVGLHCTSETGRLHFSAPRFAFIFDSLLWFLCTALSPKTATDCEKSMYHLSSTLHLCFINGISNPQQFVEQPHRLAMTTVQVVSLEY